MKIPTRKSWKARGKRRMSPSSKVPVKGLLIAVLLLLLLIFGFGCGKKAPPLPPIRASIAAPSNLTLAFDRTVDGARDETLVTLAWTHSKKTGAPEVDGFEIDLATLEEDCEGCPLRFFPLKRVDSRTFQSTVEIQPGLRHYFRIRAYANSGILSESSNTVNVEPRP